MLGWGVTGQCYRGCYRKILRISIQRPCYQRGSPCQDPAGYRTTRRLPDDRKETQTAVVWSCLPFIRSGQNHLARHSEKGRKTRRTKEEVRRQHQGMDRPRVRQVPEGSGEQGKMEKTGCKIICGAPTTHTLKKVPNTVHGTDGEKLHEHYHRDVKGGHRSRPSHHHHHHQPHNYQSFDPKETKSQLLNF